jgi:hypothetical protein
LYPSMAVALRCVSYVWMHCQVRTYSTIPDVVQLLGTNVRLAQIDVLRFEAS